MVCGSLNLPKKDEEMIYQTIHRTFEEKRKGFIARFEDGRLTVGKDYLVQLLNSALVKSFGMPPGAHGETNVLLHSFDRRRDLEQPPERKPGYGRENESLQQQRESFPVTIPTNNTTQNRLIGKLVLKSKLRYGHISLKPADLTFLGEEFREIPEHIAQHLLQRYQHIQETQVKIMLVQSHNRQFVYVGDQEIEMADNDLLLLKTRVVNGVVSFHEDDIEARFDSDWQVPEYILKDLKKKGFNGKVFIISDEKGNLKFHIKPEKKDRVAEAKSKVLALYTAITSTKQSASKTKIV